MQGIYIQFDNLSRGQKGQAAPFLIMLIAVLLSCMMLVFNVGKVSLNRVNTQNSADAGALAGSSMLASGENLLADYNAKMIGSYLAFVALGLRQQFVGVGGSGYLAMRLYYLTVVAAQAAQFADAHQAGKDACKEAKRMAYQYAFINAGIDEPKAREEGESYEHWQAKETNFQQWMKSEGYTSGIYNWEEPMNRAEAEGLYRKSGHHNELRVDMDVPGSFNLQPASAPIFLTSKDWYPSPSGGFWIIRFRWWTVIPAWILTLSPNDVKMTVSTTRVEPGADFDLWQMKMPRVTSGASSTTYGGNVYTRGYDCKLDRVW